MERIKIDVIKRDTRGKGPAGRLRKEGAIPAVVYSGEINAALSVPPESLKVLRSIHFSESTILDMEITGGDSRESIPVLIKDLQFNPLNEAVTHIDFFKVSMKEKIKVHVPVVLKGEAKGAKEEGGVLTHTLHEIEIEGLPLDVPEHIDLDISELTIGHSIHVGNIELPDTLKMITDPQETVVALVTKQEEEEEPVPEETAEEPEVIKAGKEESQEGKDTGEAKEGKKEE
jgi:large subunit ribosomal protein L25